MSAPKMKCDYGHECLRAARLSYPLIEFPPKKSDTGAPQKASLPRYEQGLSLCAHHWEFEMTFRRAINRRAVVVEGVDPERQAEELPILSFREEAKRQGIWLAGERAKK